LSIPNFQLFAPRFDDRFLEASSHADFWHSIIFKGEFILKRANKQTDNQSNEIKEEILTFKSRKTFFLVFQNHP